MFEAGFFEGTGLGIGAVEDGEIGEGAFLCGRERANRVDDVGGLFLFIFRFEDGEGLAARLCRPEFFVALMGVLGDDGAGRVENGLGRAVVLVERDNRCFGIVFLEVEDVSDIRLTPTVDRLVIVADREKVPVALGEALRKVAGST